MDNTVVIGGQWGDEGKAKITDLLAQSADIIIRYQGGCNAGHTVVYDGEIYKLHLVPSGILYKDKICFIGAGTVVLPDVFKQETEDLKSRGVNLSGLKLSPLAVITFPYHTDVDAWAEDTAKKGKIGSTRRGIGQTYTDKYARCALKIEDLFDEETLSEKLDIILPLKNKTLKSVYGLKEYSKYEMIELCKKYKEIFEPYVCFDWQNLLNEYKNKTILFEGAQGVMLDVDYGTYPFVTSSNPIAGGASVGSGYGPCMIKRVVGVMKAYTTRVGEGAFVTELNDETGDRIRDNGHEYGTTTGRPRRCGWFDSVIARYAVLTGGITTIALTKTDVFDDFDEIKICTAYKDKRNGKIYTEYPTNVFMHKYLEPVYEILDGWKQDISNVKTYDDLPQNTKKYLKRIEELSGCKISIISVGADREQTIIL